MCLELLYENFQYRGMVEFSYLAVDDKMLINKSYSLHNEYGSEYIETHGGYYNSHIFLQFGDNDNLVMTTLLNFEDIDIDLDDLDKSWELSLTKALTDLANDDFVDELNENVMTMFYDAFYNAGFVDTYNGQLIIEALQKSNKWYCRTVDFQMHIPSNEDLHPGYDT